MLNGDPAGPGLGDEQLRNRHGLNFRIQDPPFFIAEAQFRTNQGKQDLGLARTLKLGAWGHTGTFDDQRIGADGRLLADPASLGFAAKHRGNFGFYGVIDQQLYRPPGGDADSGITVYSRVSVSPSNRNLVDTHIDGGIVFAGLASSRPKDKFGAGFIYARFSDSIRERDRDAIVFSGTPGVVRDYELNLEMTYQAEIVPGWTVQPVLTRVWHPNGDASRNAWVTGFRTMWRY
jgi:porin